MVEDRAVTTEVKARNAGVALTSGGFRSLIPKDFQEAEHIAMVLAKSDIVPKEFIGKPANILLAIMYGNEIGLAPSQAMQNIMVVNGRPSLWGDAVMGLVKASLVYESSEDSFDEKTMTASFTVKRKGENPLTRTFSQADAQKASLWGKQGPWSGYPKRMLFNRARAWALRDAFPDVLKGLRITEEEQDIIEVEPLAGKSDTFAMPKLKEKFPIPTAQAAEVSPENAPTDNEIKIARGIPEKVMKYDGGFNIYLPSLPGVKFYTTIQSIADASKLAKEEGREIELAYEDTKNGHVVSEIRLLDAKKS